MSERVSVIIPTYNSATYLREALISVSQQTFAASEIIVIDDGSTDETKAAASAFNITYLYQSNAGAAAARNRGVAAAESDLIAFLDADDLWLPTKLAQQIETLLEQPQLDMVFGHIDHFISPELPPTLRSQLHCPPNPVPGYLPSTMLIRRTSWQQVGSLDTSWQVGEFIHWYLLAQEKGLTSTMLPETVARRRLHRTNQGVVKREARIDYLRILKARLDRKRGQM